MTSLVAKGSTLGALIEETRGVVGVLLGTAAGELRTVVGSVADGDADALISAALLHELAKIGATLGFGPIEVVTVKATTASRVLARQGGLVVVIELDPKRPLGELETKLRTLPWAPDDEDDDGPTRHRVPTVPNVDQTPSSLRRRSADSAEWPNAPGTGLPSELRAIGSGPVFTGDLNEFALPDLLEFLRNSQRTGLLRCETAGGVGKIQMSRGLVAGADSPNAVDVREQLLASPDIASDRRRSLAAMPVEAFVDTAIDAVLVARGLVAREDLDRARIARIYSAVREMIGWRSGRFSFDPGVAVTANPALVLSTQSILMHIYQEQDEQGR